MPNNREEIETLQASVTAILQRLTAIENNQGVQELKNIDASLQTMGTNLGEINASVVKLEQTAVKLGGVETKLNDLNTSLGTLNQTSGTKLDSVVKSLDGINTTLKAQSSVPNTKKLTSSKLSRVIGKTFK